MNFFYRILLTFSSTSFFLVIYLIKEKYLIKWELISLKLSIIPEFVSFITYLLIPIFLTIIRIFLSKFLDDDNMEMIGKESVIIDVELANNAFLPSYLGYFFVALSVTECSTLMYVFAILFLFTFLSQTLYFNPLFLLFGYHFYYVTTINRVKRLLITREKLNNPASIDLPKLKRINDFTFIDQEQAK